MEQIQIGDAVQWIRGAVGLTGICVDTMALLEDCGKPYVLAEMQTAHGRYWEHLANLEMLNQ